MRILRWLAVLPLCLLVAFLLLIDCVRRKPTSRVPDPAADPLDPAHYPPFTVVEVKNGPAGLKIVRVRSFTPCERLAALDADFRRPLAPAFKLPWKIGS